MENKHISNITTVPLPGSDEVAARVRDAVPMEDLFRLASGTPLGEDLHSTDVDLRRVSIPEYVFRTGWGDIAVQANRTDRERRLQAKKLRRAQKIQANGKNLHIFTTWELLSVAVWASLACLVFSGAMVGVWVWLLEVVGIL